MRTITDTLLHGDTSTSASAVDATPSTTSTCNTTVGEREKMFHTLLPWALLVMKRVAYSKYLIIYKCFYVLMSFVLLYILIWSSVNREFGIPYLVFFNIQGLMYIATPFFCIISFVSSLENDYITHVLSDAFAVDTKLSTKFAVITNFNLGLLIFSVVTFSMIGVELTTKARIGTALTSFFYLTPFVLMYSWFVCLVYGQWTRLEGFLIRMRQMQSTCDVKYRNDKFPFLRRGFDSSSYAPQHPDLRNEDEVRSSGSIEMPLSLAVTPIDIKVDYPIMSIDALSSKYYEELAISLAFSKCCGKWLLFFTIFSLFFAIGVVWSLYVRLYHAGGVIAFLVISLIQIFELGICVASSNESGNLICREICTFLLSESAQSRRESNSYGESNFLLGCIDHAKLEITYFGNFALRSRTLLAILGSIIGATIPGIVLHKT